MKKLGFKRRTKRPWELNINSLMGAINLLGQQRILTSFILVSSYCFAIISSPRDNSVIPLRDLIEGGDCDLDVGLENPPTAEGWLVGLFDL